MDEEKCVFCSEKAEIQSRLHIYNGYEYRCKNCGNYVLEVNIRDYILGETFDRRHDIAGYLRETKHLREYDSSREENLSKCYINEKRFKDILSDPLIPNTTIQKLDKLLIFLHKNTKYFGQEFLVEKVSLPVAYARNHSELVSMFGELVDLGYGDYKRLTMNDGIGFGDGIPTPRDYVHRDKNIFILNSKGHSHAEELVSTNIYSNKVFVAMGFNDDLLKAMENSIKPACNDCGFDAYLISDKEHNNGITDEIIVAIKTSKFIIADFTYNNCGAYFEA
ncbi:MAG: hypothetical protein FWH57_13425, partial [Oscillospiraceae bacterium]|nr:hypothetical protein [Oscillospiraceae bacterium]